MMDRHAPRRVATATGAPFGYPRILGIYMAVNALPDCRLLVDSADCATLRAELVQDNHDWFSTLLAADGNYRIVNSGICPATVVLDRRAELTEQLRRLVGLTERLVLVYAAPVTALLGIDYRALARAAQPPVGKQILVLDAIDSVGEWSSGFVQVLELLAAHLPLPEIRRPTSGKVALVGYLWDRNEADHGATVRELKRLLAGLGLETASVWLDGGPVTGLDRVAEAELLIALPQAGEAAQIISQRTGARVVRTPLPLGPAATVAWLERVAEAAGCGGDAARFIQDEASKCYAAIDKAVLRHLFERPLLLATEATVGGAVAAMAAEFGARVALLATDGPPLERAALPEVERWLENGTMGQVAQAIGELARGEEMLPLLVANERGITAARGLNLPVVPLGFQSGGIHCLYDAPFLGFSGTLSLVERMVNALALNQLRG